MDFSIAPWLFASIAVYASVTFTTFAILLISMGAPPLVAWVALAIFGNLSACLTHYGIASAPIFFRGSNTSTITWWKNGFIMSIFHIVLCPVVGGAWWKFLGWW